MSRLAGSPALVALVIANMVPIFGVLALKWSLYEIVFLYWFENVVIGFYNLVRMALCTGTDEQQVQGMPGKQPPQLWAKLPLMAFFGFHYGMFCFVHGIFVSFRLGGLLMKQGESARVPGFGELLAQIFAGSGWFAWAIVISHGVSLISNYIGKGEYRRVSFKQLMIAPYGRIVALHLAILFGALAISALGSPLPLLLILIAGKTVFDITWHLREHAAFAGAEGRDFAK